MGTEDLDLLRGTVRRFLAERSSSSHVRELIGKDEHVDASTWRQMAEQIGLQGIAIPEEFGGSGQGSAALTVICEETGYALQPSPLFGSIVMAAQALVLCNDAGAKRRYLPALTDGTLSATVVDGDALAVNPPPSTDAVDATLTGTAMFAIDGDTADLILALVGDALYAVAPGAAGVTRERLVSLDLTRRLARIEFSEAPAQRVTTFEGFADAWRDRVWTALAAEQVGGAQRCLDMAVEYAKVRVQFGRPIGTFQAIKHKCADMLLAVESARSAAYHAASALDRDDQDASAIVATAAWYCARAFTRVAKENLQIHGGIGYTYEHDAHLFLRRAKSTELLLGTPAQHSARLVHLAGIA